MGPIGRYGLHRTRRALTFAALIFNGLTQYEKIVSWNRASVRHPPVRGMYGGR